MKTIGIIGLGIIGGAWAKRYAAAGVLAGTWNRTPQPDAPAALPSPEAVASAVDVVQIVVADPPAVQSLLERILPSLAFGKCVVQSSTIDPASSARFSALVRATGASYVEAPFTGSKPAAQEGKTVYYLGGYKADVDRVLPLLERVSETRFHIGTCEQAAALKLAMNLNLAVHLEGLIESLAFARRAGIADELFFDALRVNAGWSGLAKLKEPKLKARDYAPQFSVKHMHKDMRLATATAGGDVYPLQTLARRLLAEAEAAGYGDSDFSVLQKLIEKGG